MIPELSPSENECLEGFTRAFRTDSKLLIEVRIISWSAGPHSPQSHWLEVRRFPLDTVPDAVKNLAESSCGQVNTFHAALHVGQLTLRCKRARRSGDKTCS